jgi:hypothetical protein
MPSGPDVSFALVIGGVFGALAAACAFVISYGSYQNQFMDTRKPLQLALHSAMTAFIAFFVLTCLATVAFRAALTR